MRILFATDAWRPQINGVVKTLERLTGELERRGLAIDIVHPGEFRSVPMPGYAEIRLALASAQALRERIARARPHHVHIATEGPIGWAARRACLDLGLPFTTSYHTRFPEYVRERAPVPLALSYALLRRFHNAGQGVLVATESIERELAGHGFRNLMRWGRGVDLARFRPDAEPPFPITWPRPIFLTVGRLAPEKNLDAFLKLPLPGTKVVVGDGPMAGALMDRHRQAVFLGARSHEELAGLYAQADVFVFPSRTDTFGLVLIEALACGLPVAAYPVAGPRDVIGASGVGVLSEDLQAAALAALRIDREACRRHALGFTWERSADQFYAAARRANHALAMATHPKDPSGPATQPA
jgi:glycosyltransferase involved in cell wall biosynthesis